MTGEIAAKTATGDGKTTAIVDAAQQTFLTKGFDASSMDEIALKAGVSKRTVYNRFRSKEELFGAAIEESCRRLVPVNTDEIEASLPPRDFIIELSRQFVTGIMEPDAVSLRRIAAFEAERTPSIGRSYLEHGPKMMVDLCAPILERIAARGVLNIDDPVDALWRLGALITEPLHTKVLLGARPDDMQAAVNRQVEAGVNAFFKIYASA